MKLVYLTTFLLMDAWDVSILHTPSHPLANDATMKDTLFMYDFAQVSFQ